MKLASQNIDNLGLVAGMCDEIGIKEIIDRACGKQAKNKNLTFGECVICMILNGLGFVGRTLYLYSEYFEDKPIDHLLDKAVVPKNISDNVLGRTLDKLFELGVSELFTRIALQAMKTLKIQVKSLHLDATSFHVDGEYESLLEQGESRIQLTHGYSRDHRPELKQAVLQMITANQANLPLFMQAASGNTSDKTAFSEIVSSHIKSFQEAVNNRYIVGDSAFFTPNTLHAMEKAQALFVTRVPNHIKEVQSYIKKSSIEEMTDLGNGYFGKEYQTSYIGLKQRFLVIFSQSAYERESQTLRKNLLKGSEKELKTFEKLSREIFSCEKDAVKQLTKAQSKYKYLDLDQATIIPVKKHPTVGRPQKGALLKTRGYQIQAAPYCCLKKKKEIEEKKGYFVLATNDLDEKALSISDALSIYKSQQSVERGFRFLKSPDFLVSSFYLKKPERIEALLMVMTLCLLVYSAIEYQVREKLQKNGDYFLNQKRKPAQNPTTRWIFFCFLGLHVVFVNGVKRQVTNLKERHHIILRCLGPPYQKLYYSELW